ncbi:MAG: hypothetical protein GX638_05570 [Crenarchaeota archaeon]|nr:hypothetical protein [Thermoproteota archaeon]
MRIPAAFFPVSAETLPIAKYLDDYSEKYCITTLLAFPGSGLVGKDSGYVDNRTNVGKFISSDIQETKGRWTTLLVANHSDIDYNDDIYVLTVDAIRTALLFQKEVICSAQLKQDDLNEFIILNAYNNGQFIYLPELENLPFSQDKGRLYCPIAPIVFVGGLLKEANVLEVFLSISGMLQNNGLRVIPISSNINSSLAGITTFSKLTGPKSVDEVKKVYTLNNLVKIIEKDKHPDLFIVHLSEPIIEYNEIIPNDFALFPYIVSKALIPDFFICCIPCSLSDNRFINDVSEGVLSRFGFPIDYVHISNIIIDGAAVVNNEVLSVTYTTQEDINSRVIRLRSHSKIPAFNLLNCGDLNSMCVDLNRQLKEYQRVLAIL